MIEKKAINILFAGIGGQGVLTASEITGWAALFDGFHVKKSEVHGMAQRGGSVESHLRFGKEVFSPLIPKKKADFLVCFYPSEQDRLKDYLKPIGKEFSKTLSKVQSVLGDKRYINTFMVGSLSKYLTIKEESWMKALEVVFESKYLKENKRVFFEGRTSSF